MVEEADCVDDTDTQRKGTTNEAATFQDDGGGDGGRVERERSTDDDGGGGYCASEDAKHLHNVGEGATVDNEFAVTN